MLCVRRGGERNNNVLLFSKNWMNRDRVLVLNIELSFIIIVASKEKNSKRT